MLGRRCLDCLTRLRASAERKRLESIDPSLPQLVRERAAAEAHTRCPMCVEPIGEVYADSGIHVAGAPTFVMQGAAISTAPVPGLQQGGSRSRSGRGGRGGRGIARQ